MQDKVTTEACTLYNNRQQEQQYKAEEILSEAEMDAMWEEEYRKEQEYWSVVYTSDGQWGIK